MFAITWRLAPAALMLAMAAPCIAQSSLNWETNVEVAQKKAAETNKLLLVHFGAEWCAPCQRLEKQVFNQPGFGQGLESKFVCVKLDFDQHPELASRLGVQRIPTDVILTPQGQVIQQAASPMSGEAYVAAMQRVADYVAAATASAASTAAAATPTAATTAVDVNTSAAAGSMVGDRYASYSQPQAASPAAPAAAAASTAAAAQAAPVDITALTSPAKDVASPAAASANQQVSTSPAAAASVEAAAQSPARPRFTGTLPEGSPPLALEGFSPVALVEQKKWNLGDARWGAIHHGRTYLFSAEDEQKRFLTNPERYSPVLAGSDPVLALDEGRTVDGDRRFGLFYENRVYLFHDEATLERFAQHPNRYAGDMLQVIRR